MYEMFMGPFEASKPWDMKGIEGISRFLRRISVWNDSVKLTTASNPKEIEILKNKTVAKVTDDIENLRFNTAISALMVLFNDLSKLPAVTKSAFDTFIKLLHPFAPHLTIRRRLLFSDKVNFSLCRLKFPLLLRLSPATRQILIR